MRLWECLKSGKRFRQKGSNDQWMIISNPDDDVFEIEENPKPRRLAWINRGGEVCFSEKPPINNSNDARFNAGWERAPWLDEPEESSK